MKSKTTQIKTILVFSLFYIVLACFIYVVLATLGNIQPTQPFNNSILSTTSTISESVIEALIVLKMMLAIESVINVKLAIFSLILSAVMLYILYYISNKPAKRQF
jgi:hypothetical protein